MLISHCCSSCPSFDGHPRKVFSFCIFVFLVSYLVKIGFTSMMISKIQRNDLPITSTSFNPPRTSSPNFNFGYLKIHKTGSTTLAYVLRRIALIHNLTVTSPNTFGNSKKVLAHYCYPQKFVTKKCIDNPWFPVRNITGIYHVRLNDEFKATTVPGATWITILREPVAWVQSFFHYLGFQEIINANYTQFVSNISHYVYILGKTKSHWAKNFRNFLEFSLGYDVSQSHRHPTADQVIHFMEEQFDLVLITELFDESLVLLSEISCLSISNFTYFVQNQKVTSRSVSNHFVYTESMRKDIYSTFPVYTAVYNYFRNKLIDKFNSSKIEHEKIAMQLQQLNVQMQQKCGVYDQTSNSTKYSNEGGKLRYEIKKTDSWDCELHKKYHQDLYFVLMNSTRNLIRNRSYKRSPY